MPDRVQKLLGYGDAPPDICWPGGSRLAVNFVLNVEEGAEYTIGDGDGHSESALTEVGQARVPAGMRDLAAESMYEYGSRVGFWRLHTLFRERGLPVTVFAAALSLQRNRAISEAIAATDWDIVAHGYRWIEQYLLDETAEREQIASAHASIERLVGRAAKGWYCRYSASPATRRLVVEHGGFDYDSDAYNDDLPYWVQVSGKPHLVVPYTMVINDAKFLGGPLYTGRQFGEFLIDSFEMLLAESVRMPRMMSVGMHPRVVGHPGRMAGLQRFLDHITEREDVWVCRRADIAAHWRAEVPPK